MASAHLELGALGESAALEEYRRGGFDLLARNWRCRLGEIDLVLASANTVVFCEVKTRRASAFGGGFEAVTRAKRAKLRALAQLFLLDTRLAYGSVRFDVASVEVRGGRTAVTLFEDAF